MIPMVLSILLCAALPAHPGVPAAEPPAQAQAVQALKTRIHGALLEVRRARYALRKAAQGADADAVRQAQGRLDEAKSRLKALRTELRSKLREGPQGQASSKKKARKGGGGNG